VDARYRRRAAAGRVRWDDPGLAALATVRAAGREPELARHIADEALAGRFRFLNQTRELGLPVPWDRPDLMEALLWKTHLHEFSYAVDLALVGRASGDPRYREGLFALARSWCEAEPIGRRGFHRVAWNERVVATRLVHWAAAGALLGLGPDDSDGEWLGREIVRHALFLRDNLALDLLANHVFRDCSALALADALSGCTPDALSLLEGQAAEQILPDGCHVERSPMYHAVCLGDLVDVHAVLGTRAPTWLGDATRRAAGFLESILLGDGDLPLLGDGWRGEVKVQPLLEQARRVAGPPIAPDHPERSSGLVCLTRGPLRAVGRVGPHGPDYQLGHAHADLLSFDLSAGATRLVTDTGTLQYAGGPARDRLRSTAAHNTVQIDGEELLEAWSSFRTGRRGRARCQARGETGGFAWLWGSHDAYAWLPGAPEPHRLLAVSERAVIVLDAVLGVGRHRMTSRLLLHPDAPSDALRVDALGGAPLVRRRAPLHERFGETRETEQIVLEDEGPLPWVGGFWIDIGGGDAAARTEIARDGDEVRVAVEGSAVRFLLSWRLRPVGAPDPVRIVLGSGT
jgi:uncharacterized heparinase superfamily protein